MFKKIVSIVLSIAIITQLTIPVCAKNAEKIKGDSEYIIKYSDGSDYASVKEEFKNKQIKQFKKHKKLKNDKYEVVTVDNTVSTEEYFSTITETDSVEYIVPNSAVSLFADETAISVSSEELLSSYLAFTETLEYKEDSPIIIAVADTGIDFDVIDNIYANTAEKDNFKDDDNNLFTNDIHGWNFIDNNGNTNADSTHGTVVANIINRCIPEAVILPLVVADETTGTASVSDIIDAIQYADEIGAQIMNCSWGSATYNYALKDAMAGSNMLFI